MRNHTKLTIPQINDTHGYLEAHPEWQRDIYNVVHRAIERREVRSKGGLIVTMSVANAVLAVLMNVFILLPERSESCWTMTH